MKRICIEVSPRIHEMLAEEARERGKTIARLAAFLLVREVEAGHEVREDDHVPLGWPDRD